MFATVQLLFCLYYLREFQGNFRGCCDTNAFASIHLSAMLLIMATGQTQQLITLFKQLRILPEKEIIEIITTQNSVGTPALFLAMMNGHADNVKIFMQEIQSLVYNHIIHEDNLVKLLQTKSANETLDSISPCCMDSMK